MQSSLKPLQSFITLIALSTFLAPELMAQFGSQKDRDRYFPPADMMTIGVYYYPEAWPPGPSWSPRRVSSTSPGSIA